MKFRLDPTTRSGISLEPSTPKVPTQANGYVAKVQYLDELQDVSITGTPLDDQALAYDSTSGTFIPQTISVAAGTYVLKAGDTMTGSLSINSVNSVGGTNRLNLQTYEETNPSDTQETLRIYSMTDSAKATIAFMDKNGTSHSWLQGHDYLHFYNTYTFATSDVSTGSDTLALPTHGYVNSLPVTFTTTGTLPAPLALVTTYYISVNTGSLVKLYTDSGLTSLVDLTTTGTGTHTIIPTNDYANNRHHHFSMESADSAGAKQTRISVPYGYDVTEIGFFSSKVSANGGTFRIQDSQSANKNLMWGNTQSSNLTPDGTNIRWNARQDNTAESGSNVGSDWRLTRYSDTGTLLDNPIFIRRSNGQVGIGNITNPTARLDVIAAGSYPTIQAEQTTSGTVLFPVLNLTSGAVANRYIEAKVSGDTVSRMTIFGDGKIEWGSGAITRDTSITRGGAAILSIVGSMNPATTATYSLGTAALRWGTFNGGGINLANASAITLAAGSNMVLDTATGTKIGTATSQKLALWNATPVVQPTTAVTAAAFVANTSGTLNDSATWGGYTIGQIVAALKAIGALA